MDSIATTSQNGWPTFADYGLPGLVRLPWVTGDVAAGDVFDVFDWFCRRYNAEVEPIEQGQSWGFSPRLIVGSTLTSNHASGTAVDLNAARHPLGKQGTFTPDQVRALRRILADTVVDGVQVIRWGGDYAGRKDEMHFELELQRNGNSPAKVAALAARVRPVDGVALNATRPVGGRVRQPREWDLDDPGCVKVVQGLVGATPDGIYGRQTKAAVSRRRIKLGLTAGDWYGRDTLRTDLAARGWFGPGTVGPHVAAIQWLAGDDTPDGIYGPTTEQWVDEMRAWANIPTSNGVGADTIRRIIR